MKLFNLFAGLLFSVSMIQAQVIVTDPPFPTDDQAVTITFDATQGSGGLAGYTGDVYAHTGVITNLSNSGSDWKYVVADWGVNIPKAKLERIGTDLYTLTIEPSIRNYYGVPASESILQMAFVFRSGVQVGGTWLEGKTEQNGDIFYDVYEAGLHVSIQSPVNGSIIELNQNVQVEASASEADSLLLFLNGGLISATAGNQLSHTLIADTPGSQWLRVDAKTATEMVSDSVYFFARGDAPVATLPQDVIPGINYIDNQTVTLVLHDPPALKEYVFVLGDFNDWMVNEDFYMNRTPDGTHFWVTIDELEPGREYIYQYFIDGELRLADPYTHKVSDPWHDKWISNSTYPNLIQYPQNKTTGIASVLQTAQQPYQWELENFDPPAVEKLVIYELHIRDFVATRDIKTVTDTLDYLERLGVNAIELMPFNEFEGNNSWGYNPSFYFATDKAYGRANDYKKFIDEAHKRGMAVIMDVVLNHAYTQSPMVQMYFDANASQWGQTSADNPWFNQNCPHEPWCWGHDFDHESIYTQQFIDRFNAYWMTEFKVDGFRFDFTKGFTNNQTGNQGSSYDATRVALLKRMADQIWNVNENAYVILEHFADNPEEKVLAEYGMLIWGNMNYAYNEATMGWTANSNFNWISHKARGWSVPHLIGYMESHDEERLMFKNKEYGNSSNPAHDAKQLHIATKRNAAAAAFFFAVPGPKMIWQFGELGYDYSINHCEDGTIDDGCRTNPKPVKWDYYDNWQRRELYNYYSELIRLKKEYDVFSTNDFNMSVAGAQKRINLNHPEMSVVLVGNFSVEQGTMNPAFPFTGMWYDHFNNDSISVTDVSAVIDLEPGEFILFTSKKLDSPTFVGLNETGMNTEFPVMIYPNPSNSSFTLDLNLTQGKTLDIRLMNAQGQLLEVVHQGKLHAGEHQFFLGEKSSLPGGMYFVQLSDGIRTETKKLIRL